MTDKTIRIGLTKDHWVSLYVATGSDLGRVATLSPIQGKAIRGYIAAAVRELNALRDKMRAIYGKKE